MNEWLNRVWTESKYVGRDKLYELAKRERPTVTRGDVRRFLDRRRTYQLHYPARRRFPRRRIIVYAPNDMYELDLLDLRNLRGRNKKKKYLMIFVDVFSKYAFAEPIADKTAASTTAALYRLVDKYGEHFRPRIVRSDRGREFLGSFGTSLKSMNARHVQTSDNSTKASIVERFNRTFRDRLRRWMTENRSNEWVDVYQQILDAYNRTPHRTLNRRSPEDVFRDDGKMKTFDEIYNRPIGDDQVKLMTLRLPKLNVGDAVRVAYDSSPFKKSSEETYTDEVFVIREKNVDDYPPTYKLRDLRGELLRPSFYSTELRRAYNEK